MNQDDIREGYLTLAFEPIFEFFVFVAYHATTLESRSRTNLPIIKVAR